MSRGPRSRGPLKRALWQIRSDWWLQWVAVSSLTVALGIVGAYLTLGINISQATGRIAAGPALLVALKPGVGPEAARRLAMELEVTPLVRQARYQSPEAAWKRFRRQLGSHQGLLEGLETNPLPASIEVLLTLRAPGAEEALQKRIANMPQVEEVVSRRPWLQGLEKARSLMAELAAALGLLLFAGVVLLFTNIVRLAVNQRQDALEVMALVGASRGYILAPFLIETLLQSLTAAGSASLLVWGLLWVISSPAALPWGLDLNAMLVFPWQVTATLACVAVAAGFLGGLLGVMRALRPRGL